MGAPAEPDDVELSLDDVESSLDEVVPDESLESLDVVPVVPVVPDVPDVPDDDDLVADARLVVWAPMWPARPITPKAIANVASAVATTRRRIARSRTARARSRSAATSRGVGACWVMPSMVTAHPQDDLNGAWDLPEIALLRAALSWPDGPA
jgi:hypothetical protein